MKNKNYGLDDLLRTGLLSVTTVLFLSSGIALAQEDHGYRIR